MYVNKEIKKYNTRKSKQIVQNRGNSNPILRTYFLVLLALAACCNIDSKGVSSQVSNYIRKYA